MWASGDAQTAAWPLSSKSESMENLQSRLSVDTTQEGVHVNLLHVFDIVHRYVFFVFNTTKSEVAVSLDLCPAINALCEAGVNKHSTVNAARKCSKTSPRFRDHVKCMVE